MGRHSPGRIREALLLSVLLSCYHPDYRPRVTFVPKDLTTSIDPAGLSLSIRGSGDCPPTAAAVAAQVVVRNLVTGAMVPIETKVEASQDFPDDLAVAIVLKAPLELAWHELAVQSPPSSVRLGDNDAKIGDDGRWYVRIHPGSQPTVREFSCGWKTPGRAVGGLRFSEPLELDSALASKSFILEQVSTGKRCEVIGQSLVVGDQVDFDCSGMGDSDAFLLEVLPGPKSLSGVPLTFFGGSTSLLKLYTIGPQGGVGEHF